MGLPRGARPRRVDAIFREATAVHPTGLLTPHAIAGFRPDVLSLHKGFDLFVMSSVTEGLGTSLLDAMACG